ncbi:unnamed protein product [Effrenium voratum]|nr:unnamed protein product [Effrenium voratum]
MSVQRPAWCRQAAPGEYSGEKRRASDAETSDVCQMRDELERTRRQLAEERQVSQRLQELLASQHAEFTQEVSTLKREKEELSEEICDLIQDLEQMLSEPSPTGSLAQMKRVLSMRHFATVGSEMKPVKSERFIPNWNEIMRHIGKDDDGSSIGSLMTRCASSLSSTTSLSDV